jgi:hypothetical protein
MKHYFSRSTNGFYNDDIHEPHQIPEDCVEITETVWRQLLDDHSQGKIIQSDANGYPIAINPAPLTNEQNRDLFYAIVNTRIIKAPTLWGYDDINSVLSYINSTNNQYKSEAQAVSQWRDQVWDWAFQQSFTSNTSIEQLLVNMPQFPEKPKT